MAYFWIFMRRFTFVLFFSLSCSCVFAVPSKTRASIRKAESALKNQNSSQTAVSVLVELTNDPGFYRLHVDERMEIYSLLITAYSRLKNYQEQEVLLLQLLKNSAFKPYSISLKVSLGELYLNQNRLLNTSKLIKELLRMPQRRLATDDRDLISSLHKKIEKHCEEKLFAANSCYERKDYKEAADIYQYLFDAALEHAFIQTYSKQNYRAFLDALAFRLVGCYFFNKQYKEAQNVLHRHGPDGNLTATFKGLIEKKLGHFNKAYIHFQSIQKPTPSLEWQTFLCAYKTGELAQLPKPSSIFYPNALHKRGIFYWKQKNKDAALASFFELESEFPAFSQHDEVLFFMGLLLHKKGHDARYIFAELVEAHPASPFAPESYYRMFAEQEYSQGSPQAISHLKKMPKAYLASPFGIMARFFVAAFEQEECPRKSLSTAQVKTLNEIIESLQNAIAHSELLRLPPKMHDLLQQHVAHAEFRIAECYFTLTAHTNVIETCSALQARISGLRADTRPHRLWDKAAFLKSRALLLEGNEAQAREELNSMVEYAASSGFEQSEEFILALVELAAMRTRDGEMEVAHKLLNKAELLSTGEQNEELLLEVLLAKSQLYRKKGEIDKAMMLLSSVINERSASSLRIQAMYLRAELYELKGRRDLAFRQLQTTAKKGGEWANRAAKKLEEKYGYE